MPAEQPTTLPRWATDANRTFEPSSGEKDTGWEFNKKPPARKMNWLFNLLYQWTQYLQSPKGTGTGAGVDSLGGDTSGPGIKGTGGTPNGVGVEGQGIGAGAGIKGLGGLTNGTGVDGTAVGSGTGVKGNAATTGIGVWGVGGSTSGTGVKGSAGAIDSIGVEGDGTGVGSGVKAVGGAAGYGVWAEATAASPARSAIHLVPQDTDPTTPSKGDFSVHTNGGKPKLYNGANWDRQVMQSYAQTVISGVISNTITETAFDQSYIIPANTLRAGSTIRIKAGGRIISVLGSPTLTARIRLGGAAGLLLAEVSKVSVNVNDRFFFDYTALVRVGGVSGEIGALGIKILDANDNSPLFFVDQDTTTFSLSVARDLVVTAQWSAANASNQVRLDWFVVDVL